MWLTSTPTTTTGTSHSNNQRDKNMSTTAMTMIPMDIVVPGTFVVLQGNAGDGLANTVQSLPTVPSPTTTTTSSSQSTSLSPLHEQHHGENDLGDNDDYETIDVPMLGQLATTPASKAATRLAAAAADQLTTFSTMTTTTTTSPSSTDEFVVIDDDDSNDNDNIHQINNNFRRYVDSQNRPLSNEDREAIIEWENNCRVTEQRQHKDWMDSLRQVPSHLLNHCMMVSATETTTTTTSAAAAAATTMAASSSLVKSIRWWQSNGKVAVLKDLPAPATNEQKRSSSPKPPSVIATLDPGSTVFATKIIHLDSTTLQPINVVEGTLTTTSASTTGGGRHDDANCKRYPPGQKGWIQIIQLEMDSSMVPATTSNNSRFSSKKDKKFITGYVVLSVDGYPLLGPGLPNLYVNPQEWIWRVTCPVGAFVRDGVELTSQHLHTMPYGCLIRVTKRCINNQGLSRLRVHVVDGWCSELLNPLSGQRGIVAQPLPFPVPALYRVTLQAGAVIREDVELSSPQIGEAPHGTILKIIGRAFSEHPVDRSIERLQLAGNGGWISVRLNRPPPHDELVVEFVDIDGSFDPRNPGSYHLDVQRTVLEAAKELQAAAAAARAAMSSSTGRRSNDRQSSHDDISSINEEDFLYDRTGDDEPTLDTSTGTTSGGRSHPTDLPKCVVCLTSDRNACLVHGETGHIVCCLVCARILKARGDKCPVCRQPISSVIQHFYA